jgi:NAD(P)-dependent dehydrogenase (short-subunit alcohol dehydrogenase family)
VGTGGSGVNRRALTTNVLGALAQCEAAVEHFRARSGGHLLVMSSVRAARGMGGAAMAPAAGKAAVAVLAEGLRTELAGTGIVVTTIFPGYIATPMNAGIARSRRVAETAVGVRALAAAIEREPAVAVPRWPWGGVRLGLKVLPDGMLRYVG